MVVGAMIHSAIFVPLVRLLYDPSRRFIAYRRRTIQHLPENVELRILACIHQEEDDVPNIINLLQDSYPNTESPIGVYIIDLLELMGRSVPKLIAHSPDKVTSSSSKQTRTARIIKAFRKFESRNEATVSVQCFTAIAPYATMHDDICSLALERSITLIIIPFQKFYTPPKRAVNRKVLEMAPCSVGVLVIRSDTMELRLVSVCRISLDLCLIFFGGQDDREALSYVTRMSGHPAAKLSVLRIYSLRRNAEDLQEARIDMNALNEFKIKTYDNRRVTYREIGVRDATETAGAIGKLSNEPFDLIVVGRRHDEESELFRGFSEWSELPELGVVGDMLVSSDFKTNASILIMQQQASVVDEMLNSPRFIV